ncbi:MAG TPA: UbiA family prenyltransferase [Usitatibacter sp.]|nr:UbiA family prenyltransferase [Usitatibacter sp.]
MTSTPLAVDLDGTLVRSDMLLESLAAALKRHPFAILAFPFWLLRGRAALKAELAKRSDVDATLLPYDAAVLHELRRQRAEGRWLVLATAADASLAHRVADHLGIFDDVIASDGVKNLKREVKARALTERYGEGGFDYMGEDRHDVPVWRHAREAYVVGSASLAAEARATGKPVHVIAREPTRAAAIVRSLRIYQWAKNILLLVPLLTAHLLLDPDALLAATLAFIAFSLAASAVYVANDVTDLQDDRRHPTKRTRPLASGEMHIGDAIILVPALLAAAFALATQLPAGFGFLLAAYLATNLAYSLGLKRVPLLDVFVLAGLYTLRILAGAAAVDVPVSHWLLAFSLFAFLSLALAKRFAEVSNVAARDESRVGGRGYAAGDGDILAMLGVACAGLSALVFALYITSPQVVVLYSAPAILWIAVPVLLYWMSRVWFLAHRGELHEDPLLFALRDPASYVTGLVVVAVVIAAT